jgi:hypothetical protein
MGGACEPGDVPAGTRLRGFLDQGDGARLRCIDLRFGLFVIEEQTGLHFLGGNGLIRQYLPKGHHVRT